MGGRRTNDDARRHHSGEILPGERRAKEQSAGLSHFGGRHQRPRQRTADEVQRSGRRHRGNPYQVIGQEFSPDYLRQRCHRVAPEDVLAEWKAALDGYRPEHQPDAAIPGEIAKEQNPFETRQRGCGLDR